MTCWRFPSEYRPLFVCLHIFLNITAISIFSDYNHLKTTSAKPKIPHSSMSDILKRAYEIVGLGKFGSNRYVNCSSLLFSPSITPPVLICSSQLIS